MRRVTLAALLTAAAVGLPGVTATAAPAPVSTATTPAASQPKPVPRGDVSSRVDIDGDGRGDVTTFRFVSRDGKNAYYRLSVRTARGKTARLPIVVQDLMDQPASDFWVGATGIDGIRGNEIVLDLVGGIGDATDIRSYAWRNGRLVTLPAAGSSGKRINWQVMWVDFGRAIGYTFSQGRSGIRYVTKHDVKGSASGRTFTGTNTLYRWSGKGWSKLSTKRVSVTRKVASSYTGLNGLIWR